MEEVSNKTLAVLLVGAIAVSLFGTFLVLSKPGAYVTGMATTGSGHVNVSIANATAITVTGYIDFGQGYVTPGQTSATINTNGTCSNHQNWCSGTTNTIIIENVGNKHLNINYTSSKDASAFIGGTTATESAKLSGKAGVASPGCTGRTAAFSEISTTVSQNICTNLTETSSAKNVGVEAMLVIPSDAPVGAKTTTITFSANAIN